MSVLQVRKLILLRTVNNPLPFLKFRSKTLLLVFFFFSLDFIGRREFQRQLRSRRILIREAASHKNSRSKGYS